MRRTGAARRAPGENGPSVNARGGARTHSVDLALAAAGAVGAAGAGLAILVNQNAKRGGRRVAAQVSRALPGASVRLTKTAEEVDAWLAMLGAAQSLRGVLAAGGDGTAVALVNALARLRGDDAPLPTMGVLPLGTGNGWAHALGAPKLHRCLSLLAQASGALPTRRCSLVEVEGTLAHFAGSGWDAMILDDYHGGSSLASRGPGRRALEERVRLRHGHAPAYGAQGGPAGQPASHPREPGRARLRGRPQDGGAQARPRGRPRARGSVMYDGPLGIARVGRHVSGVRLTASTGVPVRRADAPGS